MTKSPALAAHICRFNDGEQICECFVAGQKSMEQELGESRVFAAAYAANHSQLLTHFKVVEAEHKMMREALEYAENFGGFDNADAAYNVKKALSSLTIK